MRFRNALFVLSIAVFMLWSPSRGMAQENLIRIDIRAIPDNYGPETPDVFFILKEGIITHYTSPVQEADPPYTWSLSVTLDTTKTYQIEVWDDDQPFTANDELGAVTIPGKGAGTVIGTVSGASGQLEVDYLFTNTVGVAEQITSLGNLEVFPNPSSGILNLRIETLEADQYDFEILDLQGKVMFSEAKRVLKGSQTLDFDLGNLADGNYVLRLRSGEGQVSKSIQILR